MEEEILKIESDYFQKIDPNVELPENDCVVAVEFNRGSSTTTIPYIASYNTYIQKFKISGADSYAKHQIGYWYKPV